MGRVSRRRSDTNRLYQKDRQRLWRECGYLVKDRMEITGARWGLEGGEAALKLRALYINGDFNAYWAFHESQEYQRNHQAKFSEMPMVRPPLKLVARLKNQDLRHYSR